MNMFSFYNYPQQEEKPLIGKQCVFPRDIVLVEDSTLNVNLLHNALQASCGCHALSGFRMTNATREAIRKRTLCIIVPAQGAPPAQQIPVIKCPSHSAMNSTKINESLLAQVHDIFTQSVQKLYFYNSNEPFYEFTNFYACPNLVIQGKTWQTSEHYFQAQKFIDSPRIYETVHKANSPRNAFDLSRQFYQFERKDWKDVKVNIMQNIVLEKFQQHPQLAALLLRTGSAQIFEHTDKDKFWGDGGDETGQNMLGKILVNVRTALQKGSFSVAPVPASASSFSKPLQSMHHAQYARPAENQSSSFQQLRSIHQVQYGGSSGAEKPSSSFQQMKCKLSGCNKPVYPGYEFCSRTHGRAFNEQPFSHSELSIFPWYKN